MSTDLTAGIVRILKPDGLTAGTGFVVSKDGLVATCTHVVEAAGAKPGNSIQIAFHATGQEATATVESGGWRPPDVEDMAFLQLSGDLPESVVPATLGTSAERQGAQVQAFGYPDLGKVEGLWGKGELIGPVTEAKRPLLQLRSSEITAGFSGGPVWDVATGHVIGMVTQVAMPDRYGKLGEVAFAIPSETLAALRSLELAEADPLVQMRVEYLASLRQRFEYLDLGGIAPRVQNRTVKLRMADVFVPLQARPEIESSLDPLDFMPEMPEYESDAELDLRMLARGERDASAKPVDIAELLGKPRVVVLGDPGCGKSTLLRYVAYAIATGDGEAVSEPALARLPIFVRIVQYSQACAADPALTLDRYVREVSSSKWAPLIQAALDTGGALLLLDGLDEVIDVHQRKGIAEAIHALAADYPGNQFLVTSRIVGYQAARLTGDFAHYTVQPLPPERIAEFVEKWYAAIECEAGETGLSEEAQARAEELSETIQARPGIRRLAENPLLLTIIALVNWRGRKLPNRRVELYAHAAETFIESWPYRRAGVRLETERVIRLLSPVAYRVFAARSAGDIAEDELLPVLTDVICRVDGVDQREADKYAREFLSQVSEHSGIFRERGYDKRGRRVFGFLHLTFAEYFTARHLAGLWEGLGDDAEARRAFLRKYTHVPRWREVMLLMAGDVGLRDNDRAERATRLLGDILQLGSEYEENLHRDLLLVGECLADDLGVQPQASRYILDHLVALVPEPGVGVVAQALFSSMHFTTYGQYVREKIVDHLAHRDMWVRYRMARALGEFDTERAVKELQTFLNHEEWRERVTWTLGQLGHQGAVEPLLPWLSDENAKIRARVAWALGELGNDLAIDPLRERLDDEDKWVQVMVWRALEALGEQQVERKILEMEELCPTRAVDQLTALLKDHDKEVRWRAAETLGVLGDSQAVDELSSMLNDTERDVRWAVAWALGAIGDARAVEPLLTLLKDDSEMVRASAVRALRNLKDARAVDGLLERLNDKDQEVRLHAAQLLGSIGDPRAVEPL
ncbi:MAG: HEAT repeat domain-containing protein, partial [Anaerolineae bacterium]|nr:HEAT repeat domain-containing protein [Anaerolineae bacterium]